MKKLIEYSDFIKLCKIEDPKDFLLPGIEVRPDGVWVVYPGDDGFLTATEQAVLSDNPKKDLTIPALSFPCSLKQLKDFFEYYGLRDLFDPADIAEFDEGLMEKIEEDKVSSESKELIMADQGDKSTDDLILLYGNAAKRLYGSMIKRLRFKNKTLAQAERADLREAALSGFDANPSSFSPLTRAHIDGDGLYNPVEKQKRQMVGMIILCALGHRSDIAQSYQNLYKRFQDLKAK